MFSSVGVVEGSFEWKLLILHGLDVTGNGLIPVNNPFVLVAEPVNFFRMPLPDERFVIVSNCWFGPRDIVCVKRPHQ